MNSETWLERTLNVHPMHSLPSGCLPRIPCFSLRLSASGDGNTYSLTEKLLGEAVRSRIKLKKKR